MKLLYSLCLVFLICKLSVGESIQPKQIQIEPCSFCTLVVGSLQEYLKNEVNPDNIFHQIDQICSAVSQLIPEPQCNAFIAVYGKHFLTAIETATAATPDYLCRDVLQFCHRPDESPSYQPLLPATEDDSYQITWYAMENGFGNQAFYYKVFLPETEVVSGSTPVFNFYLSGEGAKMTLSITAEDYVNGVDCNEEYPCNVDIQSPPVNQWYYITVTTTEVSQPNTQFTLSITKYNLLEEDGEPGEEPGDMPHPDPAYSHTHIHIVPIFPLLVLAAVCCCCCCARRRRQCKQQTQQPIPPAQQQHEVVQLEAFPEQQMPQPPPGYFYYPPQNMMYVPQAYMPMHPVSAPPASEENLN